MKSILQALAAHRAHTEQAGLYRELCEPAGVDFSSNDYLGLSRHPHLRAGLLARLHERPMQAPLGAPASRLLRGHLAEHAALEARLAAFKGCETALLFANGFMANLALLGAVIGPQDRALSDVHNHASIIDGLRLAKCHREIFAHNDVAAVQRLLAAGHPGGKTFLVTESLFSMDGDLAPLKLYADLAERYDAGLIIDDSHAVGLFGAERASGLTEQAGVAARALAIVSTFGKALGVFGACVAGPKLVKEHLINTARPFIFTTALPPLLLCAIEAALDTLAAHRHLGARALALADLLRQRLTAQGLNCGQSVATIVPVILGSNQRALQVAAQVRQAGFDVRAVRPPTVPAATARLRISVHADHSEGDIVRLAGAVVAATRSHAPSESSTAAERTAALLTSGAEAAAVRRLA